ncbi:hypothetical protein [Brevundimonas naejangsanensis]|uniref:hypothetical protein n=1 Tax=Brevundimonas naejangsanensis TaxID=588932 RepID=UPI0014254FBB|nr:hypothetical protein [Brevundimonas naejangsanensis]
MMNVHELKLAALKALQQAQLAHDRAERRMHAQEAMQFMELYQIKSEFLREQTR